MSLSFNFRLAPSARQTNPDRPLANPWEILTIARARRGQDRRNMKIEKKKCVSAVLCKTTLQRPSRSTDMLSGSAAQSTHFSAAEPLKRHTHVYVCVYPDAQMISTLSSTAEGPKTRRSGKAAQSSYFSAAEPLKRHAQRQRRSAHVVFSGRAAQPCAFGQTSAAAPLNARCQFKQLARLAFA